jgi:hypothetical protein
MTETTTQSHADLMFDVQYGHWYNLKCERLYSRFDLFLNLIQIVGGSGAAFAVASKFTPLLSFVGVCLVVAATLSLLVRPGAKGDAHARAKRDFTKLIAEGPTLPAGELAARLAQVRSDAPTGPKVLEAPAFNATLHAMGYESGFMAETRIQKIASALA